MKTPLVLLASVALSGVPSFAASSPTAASPARTPAAKPAAPPVPQSKLALVVSVPPSMHPFLDDNVTNAIADNVLSEFRRDGYRGDFDYDFSAPDRGRNRVPRLEIDLIDWRITPTRAIECTFTASLVTSQGPQDLGIFGGTTFITGFVRDSFARADGFDDAARDAIDDLYRTLVEKNLLPGATTDA